MSDYISRDALLDLLGQQTGGHVSGVKRLTLYSVREMIKSIQATELEPVVHAHWEDCIGCDRDLFGDPVIVPRKRCSHCHRKNCKNYAPPFCPNCGARMDEEVR